MSLAVVATRALVGVAAPRVDVEVHLSGGLPRIAMVGLPEAAVREARDRVRAALINGGFDYPQRAITISLAPADLPKDGSRFDLAIALGILAASNQVPRAALEGHEFLGELALSGELRAVHGVLPAVLCARERGVVLVVPEGNGAEAALVDGAPVRTARTLLEVAAALRGRASLPVAQPPACVPTALTAAGGEPDLADVRGQPAARRALEIAAAGGHNLLFVGPPGTGKTMLATRLAGILPPMTEDEALASAAVRSVAGITLDPTSFRRRPTRAPHHSASATALVGGGCDVCQLMRRCENKCDSPPGPPAVKTAPRHLQAIPVRHTQLRLPAPGPYVVWWHGAVLKNLRTQSLPHIAVWLRRVGPDGSLGNHLRVDVGITDLGLLQVGTIWEQQSCRSQYAFVRKTFAVDYSPGSWRLTSQHWHYERTGEPLISDTTYPLPYGLRDRSRLLEFRINDRQRLLVPCLEYYARYYGRSAHVVRVLSTYQWPEAESRLYTPSAYPPQPGRWAITLRSSAHNADAIFLAHVNYDAFAQRAARSIYTGLETQYPSARGMAFLEAEPWFPGPARLIVHGLWTSQDTFLGLRIAGGSYPSGKIIDVHRENPGEAEDAAPEDAPMSGWKGSRIHDQRDMNLNVNLTADDEPDRDGSAVEVLNPEFEIVGKSCTVFHHQLQTASTRPGKTIPGAKSDRHSAGERSGSGSSTGYASIHTEERMVPSSGAVRDVWDALQHFRTTQPEVVTALGWYNCQLGSFVMEDGDGEPELVALNEYTPDERTRLPPEVWKWIYKDVQSAAPRGVLIAFVQTTHGAACFIEVERRLCKRRAEDGTWYSKEEEHHGLILVPPEDASEKDWVADVIDGIRRECGVMQRALNYCPPSARHYRRCKSASDESAGHSTVLNALRKVDIDLLKASTVRKPGSFPVPQHPFQAS